MIKESVEEYRTSPRKLAWLVYVAEFVGKDGRHKAFPRWKTDDVWTFIRDDGLRTAHWVESPFSSKARCVEESMRLADLHIPLNAELPSDMRTREDPYYGSLWRLR